MVRVHSVKEIPPEPEKFEAYFAVGSEEPGVLPGYEYAGKDSFEALVLESPASVHVAGNLAPRIAMLGTPQQPGDGGTEVQVSGPGLGETTLLIDKGDVERLEPGKIVVAPETLYKDHKVRLLKGVTVEFLPDSYLAPWESEVWLPVVRVHRPARQGCSSACTLVESNVTKYTAGFKFVGLGGGGSCEFSVDLETKYPAKKTCKEGCLRANLRIVYGSTRIDGHLVAFGTRVTVGTPDENSWQYRDIPKELDFCGRALTEVTPVGPPRDLSRATGGTGDSLTDKMELDKKISGSLTLGLAYGSPPFQMSAGFERTCARKVVIETTLAPGAKYVGYYPRPDNPLEKCWTVV